MFFQNAVKQTDRFEMKDKQQKQKERKRSLKNRPLFSPTTGGRRHSGKASFCTSLKRGGMAVETVLVLPIFFLAMVTMISFMDIYSLETEHLSELCGKAKKAGMYAYVPDGSGLEEITLPDVYSYEPVEGIVPLPTVWLHNVVRVHAWTGAKEEISGSAEEAEPMVYMTETGSVYHSSLGCSYLNLSVNQVSARQAASMKNDYGETYTACETCSRGQAPAGSVYITRKGSHYHNSETCSGLKRTVRLVKKSDVGACHACSRCG